MDYEMFLYIGSQTNDVEEMCEVNGNLTICHYLMRQYEKSKEYLKKFNKYKGMMQVANTIKGCSVIQNHKIFHIVEILDV